MFLQFESIDKAKERSLKEAKKYTLHPPTKYWFAWITHLNKVYLSVGNGLGLSKDELDKCIDELPDETPS